MYKNRANIGINYQPQLVSRISSINSMTLVNHHPTHLVELHLFQHLLIYLRRGILWQHHLIARHWQPWKARPFWELDVIVAYTLLITKLIRGVEVHVHGIPSFKAPFGGDLLCHLEDPGKSAPLMNPSRTAGTSGKHTLKQFSLISL